MKAIDMKYVRISLLPQCNFHCSYCRPKGSATPTSGPLTPAAKFKRAIGFLHKFGIRKVRFTGGEPTLYKDLPELIEFTRALSPRVTVALTTNGRLLTALARPLAAAGLDSVNISLDTLNRERFRQITGVDRLQQVLDAIDAAIDHIPLVKLNCVLMRDINSGEVSRLIDFANTRHIDIRFIEFMPSQHDNGRDCRYIAGCDIRKSLSYELVPVQNDSAAAARYYTAAPLGIRVGFIEAVSQPFCDDCNRIRLTADGSLYGCLFAGDHFNLFEKLRESPDSIKASIENIVNARTGVGCSGLNSNSTYKPSFTITGG